MTAMLLPAFLRCFNDDFVSVRVQACVVAGMLQTTDPEIIDELLEVAMHDDCWRAKAQALQGGLSCFNCLLKIQISNQIQRLLVTAKVN